MVYLLLLAASISFAVTFNIIPLLIKLAYKIGAIDNPDGRIKTHQQATPYLGGLAVYMGFITALAVTFPLNNNILLLLVGCTFLLLVGLIDDLMPLTPFQKLVGQSLAVFCFLKAGFYLKEGLFHHIWGIPLSFLWMLTVINAFNLVDVMDGLSTTIGLCAALSFGLYAYLIGFSSVSLLLACFAGSLIAFFWYNKPRARMYLGDSGALFMGGLLSALPFLLDWRPYCSYGWIAPLIILGVPLAELISLIAIRSYLGIPFYRGSPHHFSIYLRKKDWSVWQVLGFAAGVGLIVGCAGTALSLGIAIPLLPFALVLLAVALWAGFVFC